MAEQELSPLPAPWPNRDGYVHQDALLIQAIRTQVNLAGSIVPLSRRDLAEFVSRDVGVSTDEPLAEVYPSVDEETITFVVDGRTAAVLVYAARIMAASEEAHAREVRMVGDQMPEGSYGHSNRMEIARRRERVARRLRVVEAIYGDEVKKLYHGI